MRWDGAPPAPAEGRRLIEPVRHRGRRDSGWRSRDRATLAWMALLTADDRRPARVGPWPAGGGPAVVADARLFNGGELARALGLDAAGGELGVEELLCAAYRRWGAGMAERLDGEFALAVWDPDRDRLLLARDPFGARPLFYRAGPRRTWFASEPKQILTQPGVPVEPEPLVVGEYLFGRFEELERTFFAGVSRLRPGHLVSIEGGRGDQRPFWLPEPADESRRGSESLERFRTALRRAVRRRLLTGAENAAHLSGGLDSASIVVSATSSASSARLTAISCRFPGLECDETDYIREVAAAVPFPHRFVDPMDRDPLAGLEEDLWCLDSPFADLQRGHFLALSDAVDACGARLVLTGLGGDELALEESYLQDLAVRGRWGRLVVEALRAARYTRDGPGYLLRDALRPVVPAGARRLYRALRGRRGWRPPEWAARDLVEFYRSCPSPPPSPHHRFPSRTQDSVLRNVQHPELCWALEALECRAASRGHLPTHPFLDRPLVELVLAIPFTERIPGGRLKRLLRDGPGRELPRRVRERRAKTLFGSFDRFLVARHWRRIRELVLGDGEWRAQRYVSRRGVERLFESLRGAEGGDARQRQDLWRVATLELWLRQLGRYNRAARHAADRPIRERAAGEPAGR